MAKGGETISGLYLRIGLNYDELNQDFINVEESLSANIQRLNRQKTLIDIKAKVDLTGVEDAEQRLKVQQEALTKQIELQTQKVRLYETAWIAAVKANGAASQQAEKSAISLKNQELALAQLSQRLKEVTEQQKQLSQTKTDKANFDNSLLGKYTNIKGDLAGKISNLTNAFTGLKDASASADSAITKTLEIIGAIPSPVGKAVAALASIPLVARGIENSLLALAEPAIAAGDAVYVMSRGMQLSIADTAKLATVCKVTGIEINEVNSAMRRLSANLNKAGDKDNAAMKMLEKFGAQVKDSNGNLKNEVQLIDEVSKALLRAEAAGQGAAFRDIVGGRFTFLEDYAGNVELAGKIVKNGLANPALAHEVQGNINAMNTQAAQLGGVFASALMPVANDIVPRVTKEMGELTKIIAENADGIKTLGQVTADVVGGIGTVVSKAIIEVTKMAGAVGQAVKGLKELRTESPVDNDIVKLYLDDKEIENFNNLVQKELKRKFKPAELELLQASPSFAQIESTLRNQLKPTYDEIIRLRQEAEETTKKIREMNDALKETGMTTADANRQPSSPESLDAAKDIAKIFGEASDIIYKLNHNEYENKKYDLLKWRQDLINAESTTAEQRIAIEELYAAKLEQIEKEHAEKILQLQRSTADIEYSLTHDAFEKQLRDIEQWKQAQIDKADTAEEIAATIANAAMKETEAFEREVDRIKGKIESAQDRLARLTLSQRDYDEYRAKKQYQQDIKDGLPKEFADALYNAEMAQIKSRAIKGGDYVKNPAGGRNSNYSEYFRNFTPNLENQKKSLVDLDAAELARELAEDKARKAVEEFGNSLDKSKSKVDETVNNSDSLNQALDAAAGTLENADSSLGNIDNNVKGTVDGIVNSADNLKDKMSQNADALNDVSTAAGTFEQALENSRNINSQNTPLPNFPSPADAGGYRMGIIKGTDITQENSDLINRTSATVDNVIPAFEQLETAAQDLSVSIADAAPSISSALSEHAEGFSSVSGALSELTAGTDSVSSAFQNTALILEDVNQRISNLDFQQSPLQPAQPKTNESDSSKDDLVGKAFNVTSTIGELMALGGAATANPGLALLGTGISAFSNLANTAYDLSTLQPKLHHLRLILPAAILAQPLAPLWIKP